MDGTATRNSVTNLSAFEANGSEESGEWPGRVMEKGLPNRVHLVHVKETLVLLDCCLL